MTTGQLDEVKAQIEALFPHALAVLVDELNQQYNDGVAELDREAAALTVEYAGITTEAERAAALLPSHERVAQLEYDQLVLAGDSNAAGVKLAEVREARAIPLAMAQRMKEISDLYDAIPAKKAAIASKVYEQMYPEMQAVVRLCETGFFVTLLNGLSAAAEDFQRRTGTAQNPILLANRMSALTADEKSPEWQSAQRWYWPRIK